jgi:hypothetical protein
MCKKKILLIGRVVTNDFLDVFVLFQQGHWDVFGKMCFFGVNSTNLAKFLKINLNDLFHNSFLKKTLVVTKVGWHINFNISIK